MSSDSVLRANVIPSRDHSCSDSALFRWSCIGLDMKMSLTCCLARASKSTQSRLSCPPRKGKPTAGYIWQLALLPAVGRATVANSRGLERDSLGTPHACLGLRIRILHVWSGLLRLPQVLLRAAQGCSPSAHPAHPLLRRLHFLLLISQSCAPGPISSCIVRVNFGR